MPRQARSGVLPPGRSRPSLEALEDRILLAGQPLAAPFVQTIAYRVIGTTIIGTLAILMLDNLLSDKARQRRQFADRRKVARRTAGLGKRRS